MTDKVKQASTKMGQVVSTKMKNTAVVLVTTKVPHPVYGKYVTKSTRLFAHIEENQCKEGDLIVITQCSPISKRKSWKLLNIVKSSTVAD